MLGTIGVARLGIGEATVTFDVFDEDGRMVCGIYQLTGRIDARPKAWLRIVRAEMAIIETEARKAGCAEMRVAGRDWSRVLPDYEPLPGVRNGLRKAL